MNVRLSCRAFLFCVGLASSLMAQNTNSTVTTVQVPRLMRISGTLNLGPETAGVSATGVTVAAASEADVHRTGGVVGVTFALYAEETGGAPLWLETQNVQVDNTGHYSVLLGSTQAEGLPIELFTSGQAQWLGIQQQGQPEQARIMLFSVPYALKAADAETFGGKPPSAYAPAQPEQTAPSSASAPAESPSTVAPTAAPTSGSGGSKNSPHPLPITGSGTTNYLPIWTNASTLGSSVLYQSPSGGIGIGTTTPAATLDVHSSLMIAVFGNTSVASSGVGVFGSSTSTTGTNYGVSGISDSVNGAGVYGQETAGTGLNAGVNGVSTSTSGVGVYGQATSTTGNTIGVLGVSASSSGFGGNFSNTSTSGTSTGLIAITSSPDGIGLYSEGVSSSMTGEGLTDFPLGVWGDTNVSGGVAVAGTADDGVAVEGRNDSTNIATADFENEEDSNETAPVLLAHATNTGGNCLIDAGGDLYCNGTKSGVVPVDGGSRKVALYAVEAPENWFEDFGAGQLVHGSAVIAFEPTYAQTINSEMEYHVFLTPTGDCKGLYVSNRTASGFEVHELGGGTSNIGFDYRIMARRKGYEQIRLADKTEQFSPKAKQNPSRREATAPAKPSHGLLQPYPFSLPKITSLVPSTDKQ